MSDHTLVEQGSATGAVDYTQMILAEQDRARQAFAENAGSMTYPVERRPADVDVLLAVATQAVALKVPSAFKSAANTLDVLSRVQEDLTAPVRRNSFGPFDIGQMGKLGGKKTVDLMAKLMARDELGEKLGALKGSLAGIRGRIGFDQPPADTMLVQQILRRLEDPTRDMNAPSPGGAISAEIFRAIGRGEDNVKKTVISALN